MTRANPKILLPSLLDRLIDPDPDVSVEANWARSQGLTELKNSVQRDLESLLNTRRVREFSDADEGTDSDALASSILSYGLPDITSLSSDDPAQRERLREAVADSVRRFEPRLMNVEVKLVEAAQEGDRSLKLIIEAQLRLDPYPEPVRFGTTVHTTNGACVVKAES